MERTFVLVKTDGVKRKLVGEVISRLERSGLKLVALKLIKPSIEMVAKNYPDTDEWYRKVGERSTNTFKAMGMDPKQKFGTADPIQIGKQVKSWILRFMTSGKVIAMVWEGNRAVDHVRRLMGETDPIKATAGTIRGDFSIDDVALGNFTNRPIVNVIHGSGSVDEAKKEISIWFSEKEIFSYRRDTENIFYEEW